MQAQWGRNTYTTTASYQRNICMSYTSPSCNIYTFTNVYSNHFITHHHFHSIHIITCTPAWYYSLRALLHMGFNTTLGAYKCVSRWPHMHFYAFPILADACHGVKVRPSTHYLCPLMIRVTMTSRALLRIAQTCKCMSRCQSIPFYVFTTSQQIHPTITLCSISHYPYYTQFPHIVHTMYIHVRNPNTIHNHISYNMPHPQGFASKHVLQYQANTIQLGWNTKHVTSTLQ